MVNKFLHCLGNRFDITRLNNKSGFLPFSYSGTPPRLPRSRASPAPLLPKILSFCVSIVEAETKISGCDPSWQIVIAADIPVKFHALFLCLISCAALPAFPFPACRFDDDGECQSPQVRFAQTPLKQDPCFFHNSKPSEMNNRGLLMEFFRAAILWFY